PEMRSRGRSHRVPSLTGKNNADFQWRALFPADTNFPAAVAGSCEPVAILVFIWKFKSNALTEELP
ncbi:MAG: hypothetical protein ACJ8EJ_19280, partial [Xanthobacteraceae bacterium]